MTEHTQDSLAFDNNAFIVEKLQREVSACYAADRHHDIILCEYDAVLFLVALGQAVATITYARFGKISKELANRALASFVIQYAAYVILMDNYTKEEDEQ